MTLPFTVSAPIMKKTRFELPSAPNDWIVKPFSVPQWVCLKVPLAKPTRNGFPLAVKQLSAHAGLAPASSATTEVAASQCGRAVTF